VGTLAGRTLMLARELALLLADGQAHSGAALAMHFGVTRAAVWKHIEELRVAGLSIDAAAGQGYRLTRPLELLDANRVSAALPIVLRERVRVAVSWEIESTNTAMLRAASAGESDLCVLMAERQTAGRGRRGRTWQSPLGNVYFSLLKRFDGGMGGLSGLSLAAGVALAQALADVGATEVGLKWPNDVLVDGAKLAGILVELGGEFLGPCHAVIGIGVNLVRPGDIDQPVADLVTHCAVLPSRNEFAARLIQRLVETLERFSTGGFASVRDQYATLDLLRNRPLRVADAHGTREGIGAGVDERGALRVRHGATVAVYDSAEVSVRAA
jgi:BirA family biotin operon repressor/biotin-[acetyl-CoA-carboxylase] ligase